MYYYFLTVEFVTTKNDPFRMGDTETNTRQNMVIRTPNCFFTPQEVEEHIQLPDAKSKLKSDCVVTFFALLTQEEALTYLGD